MTDYSGAVAVDDDDLRAKIVGLQAKQDALEARAQKYAVCGASLNSILLNADGTSPEDPITGAVVSDARRLEIYKKCMPDAEELLSQ